jgi:hypothetical protein
MWEVWSRGGNLSLRSLWVWSSDFTQTYISGLLFSWTQRILRVSKYEGQLDLHWRNRAAMIWQQVMGHKGPILRPSASGPKGLEPNHQPHLISTTALTAVLSTVATLLYNTDHFIWQLSFVAFRRYSFLKWLFSWVGHADTINEPTGSDNW